MAAKLLANNLEYNRGLKRGKIDAYAEDMRTGNWRTDTGQTIKLTASGVLVDGQNRLQAFLESGLRKLPFDFAHGVPEEAYPSLDVGAARTFADVMRGKVGKGGERMINSAVVRRVWQWEHGVRLAGKGGSAKLRPSHSQLLARYERNPGEFDAASKRGADISRNKLGQASVGGTAFFLFAELDRNEAHTFFEQVLTGVNLPDRAPALTLSRRLLKDRAELTPDAQLILWIRAWNYFRADELVDRILTTGQSGRVITNETFPLPK